jgi:hypothetical protein
MLSYLTIKTGLINGFRIMYKPCLRRTPEMLSQAVFLLIIVDGPPTGFHIVPECLSSSRASSFALAACISPISSAFSPTSHRLYNRPHIDLRRRAGTAT